MYFKVLTFSIAFALCLGIALYLSKPAHSIPVVPQSADGDFIAAYRQWTRVNSEPLKIPPRSAQACADVRLPMLDLDKYSPHLDKYVVVFVNEIGKAAMLEQREPKFPHGSIIVKEKLSTKESSIPELLTVMKKREAGYDPANGDWEYFVFDGGGRLMQASGKLERCQACHKEEKWTDYVARDYISAEQWDKMK